MRVSPVVVMTMVALAVAVATTCAATTAPVFTKVASIPLGVPSQTTTQASYGIGEMYYTVQANGTFFALNLTTNTIAFKLLLPSIRDGLDGIVASKSGYVCINSDNVNLVFDKKGNFVRSGDKHYMSQAHRQHGEDSITLITGVGLPSRYNLKTGKMTTLLPENSPRFGNVQSCGWVRNPATEPTSVVCYNSTKSDQTRGAHLKLDYATNETLWVIADPHRQMNYAGEDDHYVWMTNYSYASRSSVLLAFDKNLAGTPVVYQFPHLQGVGGEYLNHPVTPTISAATGLLTVINGGGRSRFSLINVSNQVVIKQVGLASPADGREDDLFRVVGDKLFSWGTQCKSLTFPGGDHVFPTFDGTNLHAPMGIHPLGTSGLVLGLWGNKTVVRDMGTNGAVVFERAITVPPHSDPSSWNAPGFSVNPQKKRLVLTNGENVEVFQW